MSFEFRDLRSLDECRAVVDLQITVWGDDMDVVPASVLLVSAKRGGILVGAADAGRLVGFVWSMPGWRDKVPTHWSHMMGVLPEARGKGLGVALKLQQRDRALAQGAELVEWTFDPLQATNAHLNFASLGVTAAQYLVDVYGPMDGPLHRGTPTDRLIAEWWIRRPHVERRLARQTAGAVRSAEVRDSPAALAAVPLASWPRPGAVKTGLADRRVRIAAPGRFSEMQQQATDVALAWRMATREAFQAYFARGYQAVDFLLDRESGGGAYLLARPDETGP